MSNSQQMKKGLSVRDLITTGILAACHITFRPSHKTISVDRRKCCVVPCALFTL